MQAVAPDAPGAAAADAGGVVAAWSCGAGCAEVGALAASGTGTGAVFAVVVLAAGGVALGPPLPAGPLVWFGDGAALLDVSVLAGAALLVSVGVTDGAGPVFFGVTDGAVLGDEALAELEVDGAVVANAAVLGAVIITSIANATPRAPQKVRRQKVASKIPPKRLSRPAQTYCAVKKERLIHPAARGRGMLPQWPTAPAINPSGE